MFNASFIARGAALAIASITVPASFTAQAAETAGQRVVRFDDLNLASEAGARTLYARLRAAARAVCGSGTTRDMAMNRQHEACYAAALAAAVRHVDAHALTSLHAAPSTATASVRAAAAPEA